jgi:hypothetical protein
MLYSGLREIGIARKNRGACGAGMGDDSFHEHDDGFFEWRSAVGDEGGSRNAEWWNADR